MRLTRALESAPMFRRRIVVATRSDDSQVVARAALEDDYHHFRSEVTVQDGRVVAVRGSAPRHPYSLCADATAPLQMLVGAPASGVAHEVNRLADPTGQCTHLFELTGLAMAGCTRTMSRRQYDVEVPSWIGGSTAPRLMRDGRPLLAWQAGEREIEAPPPYGGRSLYEGFAHWALSSLAPDEAEAALVLRRATVIAKGRLLDLDAQPHAKASGKCFSQQPVRAWQAIRMVGSTWDFSQAPERLCADDLAWLDFRDDAEGATA